MQSIQSNHPVSITADRLEDKIKELGLVLVARVNHSGAAAKVDLELRATELVIFGNPKVGTLLMQAEQTAGLDLPLKILIFEDEQGSTWVSYDEMEVIKAKRAINDRDELLQKMNGALANLAAYAAGS